MAGGFLFNSSEHVDATPLPSLHWDEINRATRTGHASRMECRDPPPAEIEATALEELPLAAPGVKCQKASELSRIDRRFRNVLNAANA